MMAGEPEPAGEELLGRTALGSFIQSLLNVQLHSS